VQECEFLIWAVLIFLLNSKCPGVRSMIRQHWAHCWADHVSLTGCSDMLGLPIEGLITSNTSQLSFCNCPPEIEYLSPLSIDQVMYW